MNKIELKHLYKSYSKESILCDINLTINRGDFISIIGASGSGKSTLLNILGTLDRSFEGSYTFDYVNISSLSENAINELRNKKIGFVFQFHHLINQISILDNILLPVKENVMIMKSKVLALMKEFDILHLQDKKPLDISGGEKQRAAFLRALINDPDILFADEPTGNLDEENSLKIANMLSQASELGKTIILATHNEALSNRATIRYEIKSKQLSRIS